MTTDKADKVHPVVELFWLYVLDLACRIRHLGDNLELAAAKRLSLKSQGVVLKMWIARGESWGRTADEIRAMTAAARSELGLEG